MTSEKAAEIIELWRRERPRIQAGKSMDSVEAWGWRKLDEAFAVAVDALRASAAHRAEVERLQGCAPANDRLAATEAANVALSTENAQLRKALRVIRKGLSSDADGEFWTARKWLDNRDIYHGDLSGERVLELVAKHALHGHIALPDVGYELKHVEHYWNNGDFDGLIAFVRELFIDKADVKLQQAEAEVERLREELHSTMRREADWMQSYHDQKDRADQLEAEVERLTKARDEAGPGADICPTCGTALGVNYAPEADRLSAEREQP